MLTIVVFEIKEGKNAQKIKKNINCNLSLLIGGIIPRKFLSIQKIKILLTIIYHYLVVEKLT